MAESLVSQIPVAVESFVDVPMVNRESNSEVANNNVAPTPLTERNEQTNNPTLMQAVPSPKVEAIPQISNTQIPVVAAEPLQPKLSSGGNSHSTTELNKPIVPGSSVSSTEHQPAPSMLLSSGPRKTKPHQQQQQNSLLIRQVQLKTIKKELSTSTSLSSLYQSPIHSSIGNSIPVTGSHHHSNTNGTKNEMATVEEHTHHDTVQTRHPLNSIVLPSIKLPKQQESIIKAIKVYMPSLLQKTSNASNPTKPRLEDLKKERQIRQNRFPHKEYLQPLQPLSNTSAAAGGISSIPGISALSTPSQASQHQIHQVHASQQISMANSVYMNPTFKIQFFFLCEKGNNSAIVRKILLKRDWWQEATPGFQGFHFRWKPTSFGIKFDELVYQPGKKQMVNHLEHHQELSIKSKLFQNLRLSHKADIQKIMPSSYLISVDQENFEKDLRVFLDEYLENAKDPLKKNVWILKPDDLNRGQGISVFNTLETLHSLLAQYSKPDILNSIFDPLLKSSGGSSNNHQPAAKVSTEPVKKPRLQVSNLHSLSKFVVIQKYIENPLLIHERKFDIRVWVLVDSDFKFYIFKEGYMRLSSEQFSLNEESLADKFVHLTNNAIQKHGKNYGKFENGNIISYSDYDIIMNERITSSAEEGSVGQLPSVLRQIKDLIKISFSSTRKKLFKTGRRSTFEIFGYDFMVDSTGHTYLIEVNTNPCIEESNAHLAKIVPRMLNDAFRMTIDKAFCSNRTFNCGFHDFAVDGYSDSDILWEEVGSLNPFVAN